MLGALGTGWTGVLVEVYAAGDWTGGGVTWSTVTAVSKIVGRVD